MKICGRRDYLVNLESVAMTDIVLNMFIFFFISFSLLYTFSPNRLQKLGIKLPKVKNVKPLEDVKQVNISINKDGIIYLEKEAVTSDELLEEVYAIHKKNSGLKVLLQADKLAQFNYIAKVLDILSGLEVKNISIAVETEK